jgi:hypothetical protein
MIGLRKRIKQRPNIVKTQKRRDPLQNGFMSLFFEVHLVKRNKQGKQRPKVKYKNKYQLGKQGQGCCFRKEEVKVVARNQEKKQQRNISAYQDQGIIIKNVPLAFAWAYDITDSRVCQNIQHSS